MRPSRVPPDAIWFGSALHRVLQRLERANTRNSPTELAKTDMSDTFLRVWVALPPLPVIEEMVPTLWQQSDPEWHPGPLVHRLHATTRTPAIPVSVKPGLTSPKASRGGSLHVTAP